MSTVFTDIIEWSRQNPDAAEQLIAGKAAVVPVLQQDIMKRVDGDYVVNDYHLATCNSLPFVLQYLMPKLRLDTGRKP